MKKVAILGATGYIGRSLIPEFISSKSNYSLTLFSRAKGDMYTSLRASKDSISIHTYDKFFEGKYDVILNCTGIGDPKKVKKNPSEIFFVTESIDALVIEYLEKHPKTLYINLSSGAVYGNVFMKEINEKTGISISSDLKDTYSIAKINAEAKHRALKGYNIVDLRIFSFFSRFLDTNVNFLMSEIVHCLKTKKLFLTSNEDIMRDYITPKDLFSLLELVMKKRKINTFFDVYSKKPISKFELLSFLQKKYEFHYKVTTTGPASTVKNNYYSKNKKAKSIGYTPSFSSLKGIEYELNQLLKKQ